MLSEFPQTESGMLAALQKFAVVGARSMARKKSSDELGPRQGDEVASSRRGPMREFSRSLPMSLLRAREAVMRQFRPSLRSHGLTEQQWRILRALTAVDEIEVTELARVAFLLGPSLSRILRDLEARALDRSARRPRPMHGARWFRSPPRG